MRIFMEMLRDRPVFLWVIFLTPAASTFGHYLAPNQNVLRGHDWGIVVAFGMAFLAMLTWFPYRGNGRWPIPAVSFLMLTAVTWGYQALRTQIDGSVFNLTAFLLPAFLLMLALKVPLKSDLTTALLVLAYSIVVISIASLPLGTLDFSQTRLTVGGRIPIFLDFGSSGRWGGPFGDVNYAAPIGGLLVIIGAAARGIHRVILLPAGGLILAMSQGRTALIAVIAALLVLILWSARFQRLPHFVSMRNLILALATLGLVAYLIGVDPTLNGRTPIWANFSVLLASNPIFGVGTTGVIDFVVENEGQPGFVPHTHAHSVLLDGAARHGLAFVLLTLAMYTFVVLSAMKALPQIGPGPLALIVYVIFIGTAETPYSWIYWSTYLAVLTYVVLISATAQRGVRNSEADLRSETRT